MSQWNDLSRDRLIKEYRKYPCLWSNKDEDIKNAEKRKECLAQITAELNKYEQQKTFTQEEVRTQFKNLRDMYRRKRKKLQLQMETNVSVDEPGWVYFQRLKFLDDAIDFTLPSDSAHLPPPKKKGKTCANRAADDASLPTPLEENSNDSSSAGGVFPYPPNGQQQQHTKAELTLTEEQLKQEMVVAEEELLLEKGAEGGTENAADGRRNGSRCGNEGATTDAEPAAGREDDAEGKGETTEQLRTNDGGEEKSGGSENTRMPNNNNGVASFSSSPRAMVAEICAQMPLNAPALFSAASHPQTLAGNSDNNLAAVVQLQQRRIEAEEEDAEEFTSFGRFVALTLRKITAISPIDALEARKEISDVLYFYQKRSLSK